MQVKDALAADAYYQFDNYILDPDARTLRHGDKLVELTPKVFTTLLALVENRDKVLTKDELLTIIWPDQFIDQSNLSQNISVLRKNLGESESGNKYIATFPGRGYRFVARVEVKHSPKIHRAAPPHGLALPAVIEVEANSTNVELSSRPNTSKNILRSWKSNSIALWVVILVAFVAFTIGKYTSHPKLSNVPEDNATVKILARMNAGLTQPTWSRDGSAIAFVSRDLSGTRSAVYVESKGDIQPHSLISDSGQYSSPAWSPDGKLLAFLHFEPGSAEIVIFDTQRKSSRVITTLFPRRYGLNYRHLDWSPDGKFLVVDDKSRDSEPFSLYLIYIEDGKRVRLTYPDSDMIGDVSPRVSPDGTQIAFIRDIDFFEQDLYITNVRGRTYQRITSAHTLISDVGWTKNKILAFAADNGGGFKFWQIDMAKPDNRQSLASPISSDRALQFSVRQNGELVAYSNYDPNLDIWSLDTTGRSDAWVPVIQAPGESIRPSVSPDGKLLAFLSNVSGDFQLWVSQVDGEDASMVPTGSLVPASFCWSADGKSLIFSPQHVHGLYEVPVRGNAQIRQISSIYTDPQYAVDGKSLFVRAHYFIYRVPLLGGKAQEVTEQGGAPIAQSRDGRYLYFSQGRMSATIARLDLQTGHQDELISSLFPGYSDTWALSSRGVFFLGQEHNQPAIRFFTFATDQEERVANFPGELPEVELSGFGVSPDGKSLWVVGADPVTSAVEITTFKSD